MRRAGELRWVGRAVGLTIALALLLLWAESAGASGPRWVAGVGYFNASVNGQPVVWANGQVTYFTDLSDLSAEVNQAQANAMVATAAAVWSGVPTAAVSIRWGGNLAENVDAAVRAGSKGTPGRSGIVLPADLLPGATGSPVGVVYDETGAVINGIYGAGANSALDCRDNGVIATVDNLAASGNLLHALIVVNGQCATTAAQIGNLQYQLVRAFGRVLGLDWSQANEEMFAQGQITIDGILGWPVMHPMERFCTSSGGTCMPYGAALRPDDVAGLNRLYPVTAENIGNFPGSTITAAATISVQGTVTFARGQGMQGVNVVLRPLVNGVPDVTNTVTAVSGVLFAGNAGNPVDGFKDAQGNLLSRFGSADAALEGFFDLSGVPLPAGVTTADYQLTFEAVNPLYAQEWSVGPYATGQVAPSGTMPVMTLPGLSAGSAVTETVVIEDSADEAQSGGDGTEAVPAAVPVSGEWSGRITGYGHTGWFAWWARGGREFTIEAQALDETGAPTENKAQMVIGAWNGTDPVGSLPATGTGQAFNGAVMGLTALPAMTGADSEVRIGLADLRGDGRPDYAYHGRVLYADSVTPSRMPVAGGAMTIRGMGFRPGMTVTVNGVAAQVTSVVPNTIAAVAPASGGVTGTVPVEIQDPVTLGITALNSGFSYDAQAEDGIELAVTPPATMPMDVPWNLTARAMNLTTGTPAAGVTVTFTLSGGTALLGCARTACSVTTGADGTAVLAVTANSTAMAQVTAKLTNGSSVAAQFAGCAPPAIAAVTPNLYIAMGATVQWPVQVMALTPGGVAVNGQIVTWSTSSAGIAFQAGSSMSNAHGMAANTITAGPFTASVAATLQACWVGTNHCAVVQVIPVQLSTEKLVGWSGTAQFVKAGQAFAPFVVHVTDAFGNPVAGANVTLEEAFYGWTQPCGTQGSCPEAPLLGQQRVLAVSGLDGSVTQMPLREGGLAGRLLVTAIVGAGTEMEFELDACP